MCNFQVKKEGDPVLAEINQRIEEAFDVFDHEQNKTVDVREVGTIVRSLGCYPTEADLQDIIQVVLHEDDIRLGGLWTVFDNDFNVLFTS